MNVEWRRLAKKSGPCDTVLVASDGGDVLLRWHVRRDAHRGPWVIVDELANAIIAGGYPSMRTAREDAAALVRERVRA